MYFAYGEEETDYLKKKDKRMAEVIDRIGHVERKVDTDLFSAVVHHIVGQQISTKAQETIWQRMLSALGEVNAEKVRIVQDADFIYRDEVDKAAAAYKKEHGENPKWLPNQYFAALTNMRSVGVMGDERTYDYAVALRAVNTIDFMTAEAAEIPFAVLQSVMSRIINEVRGVNRVFYDLTSKPPGTIEFE